MQQNNSDLASVVASPVAAEQPMKSNFLVILLSILLLLSVSIAGFFAYQTQKLVKELTVLKSEEKVVVVATTEPVATNSVIPASEIPASINKLYAAINSNFKINPVPVVENQFYSPAGMVTKESWKLDLTNTNLGKSFTTFLLTQLSSVDSESGGIGGGGIDAYENKDIKCYRSYGYRSGDPTNWKDPFDYLSCAVK